MKTTKSRPGKHTYTLITSPITSEVGFDEPLMHAAHKISYGVDALTGWESSVPLANRDRHQKVLTPRDEKIFNAIGIILCQL